MSPHDRTRELQRVREMDFSDKQKSHRDAKEALHYAFLLLIILGVGKSLQGLIPFGADLVSAAVVYFQIALPMKIIAERGELPRHYGIHAHGTLGTLALNIRRVLVSLKAKTKPRSLLRRTLSGKCHLARLLADASRDVVRDDKGFRVDLSRTFVTMLVTFLPFIVGYHLLQSIHVVLPKGASTLSWVDTLKGAAWTFELAQVPSLCFPRTGMLQALLIHVVMVALPEEIFYRGFLETSLVRHWKQKRWLIVPLSRGIWIGATLFALGHFLGEWNPFRLGPFFPAFVFSMLVRRSSSIMGSVIYHAASNILAATLTASYLAKCGGWISNTF